MPVMILTMLVVLVVAAGIIAVVVMGMEGTGRQRHPEIAEAMARTARHLNGDGEPPRALLALFDELDEVPDVREIPERIRSMRSARSAESARSAASAGSAAAVEAASPVSPTPSLELAAATNGAALTNGAAASATNRAVPDARGFVRAALASPAVADPAASDPYGVWGARSPSEPERDTVDRRRLFSRDTVARGRLPGVGRTA